MCGLLPDGVDDEEEVNLKAASPEDSGLLRASKVTARTFAASKSSFSGTNFPLRKSPKESNPEETSKEDAARAPSFEVRKLWPHLLFSFFYAVMYGGSDFYMVEMVAEASGNAKEILVSWHIFWPFALTNALAVPSVGELMLGPVAPISLVQFHFKHTSSNEVCKWGLFLLGFPFCKAAQDGRFAKWTGHC